MVLTVITFSSIMIAYNQHLAQLIFFALMKLMVLINLSINVLISSYQCAIISEMTINISLHGTNCNL